MEKRAEYWAAEYEHDRLYASFREAVEEYLYEKLDDLPKTLKMAGWAQETTGSYSKMEEEIGGIVITALEDNFEGSFGKRPVIPEIVWELAGDFARDILENWPVLGRVIVEQCTIDVPGWIKENQPEWRKFLDKKGEQA